MPPATAAPAAPKLAVRSQVARAAGPSTASADLNNLIQDVMTDKPKKVAAPAAPAPDPLPNPVLEAPPKAPPKAAPEPEPEPEVGLVPDDVLAAPEPEVTPVIDGDDDDAAPDPTDPKANTAWQQVKREKRELRDQLKASQQEVERLRTTALPEMEEVNLLRTQIQEYEGKIGQYDLASTKQFKNRFDAPMESAKQRSVSTLTRAGRDPEDAKELVQKIFAASGEELNQLLNDEPYSLQGPLMSLAVEYGELSKQRDDALAHWQQTKAAVVTQASRDQEISLAENIERDAAVAVQQALKEGNWMFARSKDNQEWNAQVDQRMLAVKGILRSAKPDELVKWVMEGITAQPTRELFKMAQAKYAKTKAELDRLVGATPRIRGGDPAERRATAVAGKPREAAAFVADLLADAPRRAF